MKLKSFGCSFIFGTDLHDDGKNERYASGSCFTWPALIAKKLGYQYKTHARPGSGNLQILERLLNNITPNDPSIYVVGWTWIDRFDYIDPDTSSMDFPGTRWNTLMPIDNGTVAEVYYKNLHSEYQDKLTSLLYIKTAINILQDKNCKFIMTYMDDLIFCDKWNTAPPMIELIEEIRPFFNQFQGQNFLKWSQSQGFKISDMLHPLEDAHQAAADLILSDLDNWVKS